MFAITFDKLWSNHPSKKGNHHPCSSEGKANFENQCAIRMGVALKEAGVDLKSFKGARCWFRHGHDHILRAEELADWLKINLFTPDIQKRGGKKRVDATRYKDKSGVVLCRNFWGSGNQGDHIDLWNGEKFAKGDPSYFSRSEEVWFWDI